MNYATKNGEKSSKFFMAHFEAHKMVHSPKGNTRILFRIKPPRYEKGKYPIENVMQYFQYLDELSNPVSNYSPTNNKRDTLYFLCFVPS